MRFFMEVLYFYEFRGIIDKNRQNTVDSGCQRTPLAHRLYFAQNTGLFHSLRFGVRENYSSYNASNMGSQYKQEVLNMNKLMESTGRFIAETKKDKYSPILIIVLIVIIIAMIPHNLGYTNLENENKELHSSLSETASKLEKLNETQEQTQEKLVSSEQKVQLLTESTNALKEQVSGLNAEKEELNNKLEELLNVRDAVPVVTKTMLEESISSASELVTKRYMYRNAKQQTDSKEWIMGWTMPFSSTELLAVYDGTITASIDLREVKFGINESAKTITVTMPKSKIFDHNIPTETINVLEVKNNLLNSISFNDYNQFIAAEKPEMEQRAIDQGLLTEADKEAKAIIEAFLKTVPGIDQYKLIFQ